MAGVPIDVGLLGGYGQLLEADGAAEGIDDGIEFGFGIAGARRSGDGLERGRSSYFVGFPAYGDCFAGEGPARMGNAWSVDSVFIRTHQG